jgi:hypothetical protein
VGQLRAVQAAARALGHELRPWQQVRDDGPYTGLWTAECACGLLLVALPDGRVIDGAQEMMACRDAGGEGGEDDH